MRKPRLSRKKAVLLLKKGQSVVEYLVLFVLIAGFSIALVYNVPAIFQSYVSTSTGAMK